MSRYEHWKDMTLDELEHWRLSYIKACTLADKYETALETIAKNGGKMACDLSAEIAREALGEK